tara:strand:- start:101 stop:484 length:384 start_codon:yes stop_codon:yes gene_type:complete
MGFVKRPNILIVEDDIPLAEAYKSALEELRYTVVLADSPSLAISRIKNQTFDLILLDLHLRSGNGVQILDVLVAESHEDPEYRVAPVILTSGQIEEGQIIEYRDYIKGALVKPFQLDTLIEKVQTLL